MDRDLTHFWLRRVHSLMGMFLGVFLLEHFFINAFAFNGAEPFNEKAELLRSLPLLELIEITFLGIPFAFHGIYGLYIVYTGRVSVPMMKYGRNWMYVLQRVSGVLALVFLVYHVWTLRIRHDLEGTHVDFFSLLHTLYTQYPLTIVIYLLGVWSAIFHFANGILTFCMTWGLTVTVSSQRLMIVVAVAVGLGYGLLSMVSVCGFYTNVPPVEVEKVLEILGWQ